LSDNNFSRFLTDFQFLFKIVRESEGEYDLRIREDYFNVYYKGNSLIKVEFLGDIYRITIHESFTEGVYEKDDRFSSICVTKSTYKQYQLAKHQLHPFLQKKYLNKIASKISEIHYGEEIVFEQILITDNRNRDDLFIIDRQTTETTLHGKKIDLLALVQDTRNKYRLLVIEIKLGNSTDLTKKVGDQISFYVEHIKKHIDEWICSYQKCYEQLKQTGIFDQPKYTKIEILPTVSEVVVVSGHSGIAKRHIEELKRNQPEVIVKSFLNIFDSADLKAWY